MYIGNSKVAMSAQRNWRTHNNSMNKALERLSSGLRINRAADDPAGLAVSEKIKMQLTLLKNDKYDAMNKMSALDVADGAMGEVQNMLERMLELADLSMNETYSDADRSNMNKEYQQLLDEINRIGKGTEFNSCTLFGGGGNIKALVPGAVNSEFYIGIGSSDLDKLLDNLDDFLSKVSEAAANNDDETLLSLGIDRKNGNTDTINFQDAVNNYIKKNIAELSNSGSNNGKDDTQYTMAFKNGKIEVRFPELSGGSLGLGGTDISTAENAKKAAKAAKSAIDRVSDMRGDNGAMRRRLEHTMNMLDSMSVDLTGYLSRIVDADMAEEMMNFVKEKLLSEVSSFVMVHTNQEAEKVIKLLEME